MNELPFGLFRCKDVVSLIEIHCSCIFLFIFLLLSNGIRFSRSFFFVLPGGKDANVLFHRYFQNRCHKRRRRERKRMQMCFDIHRSVNGWMFVFCSRCQHRMVTHRGNEEKREKSFSRLPRVNDRIICNLKNLVSAVATRWRWQVRERRCSDRLEITINCLKMLSSIK